MNTNLELIGLSCLLRELLVGRPLDGINGGAVLELEVRYSAPFAAAITVALQNALRRAADALPECPCAPSVAEARATAPAKAPSRPKLAATAPA